MIYIVLNIIDVLNYLICIIKFGCVLYMDENKSAKCVLKDFVVQRFILILFNNHVQ